VSWHHRLRRGQSLPRSALHCWLQSRFTVKPAQPDGTFVKLAGIELELVLSSKHERVIRNDNTVTSQGLILQTARDPPPSAFRALSGDDAPVLQR
jgi:hypothetical protein